jgi:hypothetical protein
MLHRPMITIEVSPADNIMSAASADLREAAR